MWRFPRLRPDSGLFRRRGFALVLTLAIEALLILLLLFMIPPMAGNKKPGNATVFSVDSEGEEKAEATKAEKSAPKASAKAAAAEPKPSVVPPPEVPPPPVPPTPTGPLPFIQMTRQEYSDANAALGAARPSESAAAGNSGGGSSRGDTPLAGGSAPGGEPLYAAEWYRRPTHAELNAYMARGANWAPEGVGIIACRTVARYHVEDCKIIGESPKGAGYGYAVLQASFQFLVRPPRVGGKEMVGTWVSIRIDYSIIRK